MEAWPTTSDDGTSGELQKVLCEDAGTIGGLTSAASESICKVNAVLDRQLELKMSASVKTARSVIATVKLDDVKKFQ